LLSLFKCECVKKSCVSVVDQNGSQYTDTSGGSKIIFPGQPEVYRVNKFTPEVSGQRPKCADEDDFCESAEDYPLLVITLPSCGNVKGVLYLHSYITFAHYDM
jgi:hypothetical protein